MAQETNGSPRRGLLIAAAATALTVAAGLTAGALLGYVGPARTSTASAPATETASSQLAALDPSPAANAPFADGSPGIAGVEPSPAESPLVEPAQEDPRGDREAARGEEEHERGERGHHDRRERHERHERHERGDDDDD